MHKRVRIRLGSLLNFTIFNFNNQSTRAQVKIVLIKEFQSNIKWCLQFDNMEENRVINFAIGLGNGA